MATVLTIDGSAVDRTAAHVTLGSLDLSVEDPERLTFTELCVAGGPGSWSEGQSCVLTIDGTDYFIGVVTAAHPSAMGGGSISVNYSAIGLRWLVNTIWISASDGTGYMAWNLPGTDPDYLPSNSGQTLGAILTQILVQHTSQLAAIGLAGSPPYSTTELAALTVVPNAPIVVSGRLMSAIADLISQWAPKYWCYCSAIDGKIHIQDTLTLPDTTLTLDSDPVTLDSLGKSHQECYTKVIIRGNADVQGAFLSLGYNTLQAGWTAAQQAAWTIADYNQPRGAFDKGNINSMSSTTLTVASFDATRTWALNYWNGIGAVVYAINPLAPGITCQEQARVTACTALTAGGTSVLTLDHALQNSGYTKYEIRGTRTAMSEVWRKFNIVPTYVAQHLARRFQRPVPWSPNDSITTYTIAPQGNVCWSNLPGGGPPFNEFPLPFEMVLYDANGVTAQATVTATISAGAVTGFTSLVGGSGYPISSTTIAVSIMGGGGTGATAHATSNSSGVITSVTLDTGGSGYTTAPFVTIGVNNGYIMFYQPITAVYVSQAVQQQGGSAVPAPGDVKVLVPYSRGALTATAPASSYEGTAFTVDGVERTMYRDFPNWRDSGDAVNMGIIAQESLDAVKDTVIEGSMTYYGKALSWLTLGKSLNIARDGGTTGWETLAAPVKSVSIEYQNRAVEWAMKLSFSTRRKPFSGDRMYAPVPYAQGHGGGNAGFGAAMATGTAASMAGMREAGAGMMDQEGGGAPVPMFGGDSGTAAGRGKASQAGKPRAVDRSMGKAIKDQEAGEIDRDQAENARRTAARERERMPEENAAKLAAKEAASQKVKIGATPDTGALARQSTTDDTSAIADLPDRAGDGGAV